MRLGQQRNRKLESQPFEKYIFKVKSITPALSLRTRITAVVVLILFASGILITYFNSVATEKMLFRDAENSSELIASEFNFATRSSPKVDTAILKSSARLALRLLPDAEFIGFFQKSDSDSISLAAFAGRPLAEKELSFIKTTLTNVGATKVSVSSVRSGNSLYSYSILRYNKDQVWGYALTEVTLSKVRQTVRRSQATGAVITLVVSVLASILLLFAMRLTFLRPFGDLAKGMREAAGGNMDARLSLSSGTEFRTLSTIFNEMMSELQKAHEIVRSEVKRQEGYNVRLQKDIALATDTLREKSGEIISLQEKLRTFESQAALGKVASKLAHELGSPLNAIYTSVQLLLENNISAEEKRKLVVIQRQVETMIAIINRSLQSRKIAMPAKQEVVLKNLVEETRSVMEPKMRGRSIKLDVQLDKPLTILYADPVQIQQVLINLLNNSIEAIEARESKDLQGKIVLKAYEDKEQEIENIRFDISDNGEGVSREVVGQLFNDFINSKKPNGNGIGLVICKEIVDRHGGRIFLSRTSENGSTFSVILPIRDER